MINPPEMKPAARVSVTILGEATVELSCDAGAELPVGMIALTKETVRVLAEKRLAWWNPID